MKTKPLRQGFSLIEMLAYVAILSLMLLIVLQVVVSVVRSQRLAKSARSIENSAAITLERMTRELRQAESIDVSASTLGSHPGHLVLEGIDEEGEERTVDFSLIDGRLYMSENSANLGALTESAVTVTNLVFRRFASSTVEGIKIEMTLESGTSTHYRTETFYASALLR